MWQELAEAIDILVENYKKLQALGNEKSAVLVNVDIKALEKIVHQEEAVVETINKAEQRRQKVINRLASENVTIEPDMQMRDVWSQCPDNRLREVLRNSHRSLQ